MTLDAALSRLRRTVDESLFPDAPPPPRITRRRALVCGGLALAAIGVQLARMSSSAPLDSIWAEDGYIWLADAMGRGFFDALTTPYNGYLQTVSRLVAEPVSWLGVGQYAAAMALSGAAIVTGCAFVVWRASAGQIQNRYLRATLAGLVVALPVVGVETLDNVTNTIWFLLFAAFWILLWRPATFARAAAAAALLLLAAISNAGVLFLLPIWLLRLLAARDRRDGIILAAFAAGLLLQLGISWGESSLLGEAPGHQVALTPHWSWDLVPAYAQRVVGGAIGGQWITGGAWEWIGTPLEVVLGAALLGFLAVALLAGTPRVRLVVGLAVAISVAMFLVAGYRRWDAGGSQFLWPEGISNTVGSHYMVVPTLLLLSALFAWLDAGPGRLARPTRGRIRTAAVLVLVVAALTSFSVGDSAVRGSPTWGRALDDARAACAAGSADSAQVVIAPTVAYVKTTMPIDCERLVDR